MKRTTFILALIAALAACNEVVALAPEAHAMEAAISDRLFMGRGMQGGASVTDAQWKQFLDEVVTPRFPDGLTIYRAEGQWRESSSAPIQAEGTFVLEVMHGGSAAATRSLEEIAAEYKRRFQQSSVLHTRSAVQMSFL